MRVLITGYTGFLGRYIARALKQEGFKVRVIMHQRTVAKVDIKNEADELIWGSIEDAAIVKKALKDIDAVIHSAWKFSAQTDDRPTLNERITELIFKESINQGVKFFAFLSSISVYGMEKRKDKIISEASKKVDENDRFIYQSEKAKLEKFLETVDRGSMILGIFRPGPIIDESISPAKKNLRIAGKNFALGIGDGRNHMPYIHAADVADAIQKWLINHKNDISVYNITPSNCMIHRDWLIAWGNSKGMKIIPIFLRTWIIRLMAIFATILKKILRKSGKVNLEYAILTSIRDLQYDNSSALDDLNWKPTQTNRYKV